MRPTAGAGWLMGAAALICLSCVPEAARADAITGAILADMCVKHEPRASYYILGSVDAFNVHIGGPRRFCIPGGAEIPGTHLTNIVCGYVVGHPGDQDRAAGVMIYRSLRDAFPCGARR